jgi:hypothetical protein
VVVPVNVLYTARKHYLVPNSDPNDNDNRYYSFTGGHFVVVKEYQI